MLIITLLLRFIPTILVVAAQRNFVLHITSISLKFDESYAGVNITYNDSFVSFLATVKRQLNPPLVLHTILKLRSRDKQAQYGDLFGKRNSYKTLANKSINYCEFLLHAEREPILNLLHHRFLGNPNNRFVDTCPIAVVGVDLINVEYVLYAIVGFSSRDNIS